MRLNRELRRVVIVDGYVDEPTCLGVPPYISTYPRYIAGAIWNYSPRTEIVYQTIDMVRTGFEQVLDIWSQADLLVLIAGMIVPGKYLGGTPISVREAKTLFSDSRVEHVTKLLVGPWARFGCGLEGGRPALSSDVLQPPFDYIITGDAEIVIGNLLARGESLDETDLSAVRENASEIDAYAIRGASIVRQCPGLNRGHVICEIETYRGCPRFISGGCSFCTEPLYGPPQQREVRGVLSEVEALYSQGVRAFRIGRQADIFTYGSEEMGESEFPRPAPEVIESLFSGLRHIAPHPAVIHIDNVNPGTIARHPDESRAVAKTIMKYHTTGDVAALGIESTDPEVIRRNNLKVLPDEAMDAIRVLNEVGGLRPYRELPHLLPGVNLVYGLPGETEKTLEYDLQFLRAVMDEGLLLRRINIRQVIAFPKTRITSMPRRSLRDNLFFQHKQQIRQYIDIPMLRRVAPHGTIIRSAFVEGTEGKSLLLRPLASYPLLCHMPGGSTPLDVTDVFVVDHGPRSVTVLPYPLNLRHATLSQLCAIPAVGPKRAARLKIQLPHTIEEVERTIEIELPTWLKESISLDD